MNQPEIKTGRLLLRSFQQRDAKQVQKLAGNNNVSKTTLNIPHPYENDMAEEWIKTHSDNWTHKSSLTYAITNNKSGQLLGAASLVEIKGTQAKLGYWIGEPYWGKGYCTEATIAIINLSFTELGIQRIIAEHLSSNYASAMVMKKSGMYHIGSSAIEGRDSEIVDIEIYEIQNT